MKKKRIWTASLFALLLVTGCDNKCGERQEKLGHDCCQAGLTAIPLAEILY